MNDMSEEITETDGPFTIKVYYKFLSKAGIWPVVLKGSFVRNYPTPEVTDWEEIKQLWLNDKNNPYASNYVMTRAEILSHTLEEQDTYSMITNHHKKTFNWKRKPLQEHKWYQFWRTE